MIDQKTKITNKKFYNKWVYKVSLKQKSANIFRTYDLNRLIDYCTSGDRDDHPQYSTAYKSWDHRSDLLKIALFLQSVPQDIYQKRIENINIDIYTNDVDFYNKASIEFEDILIQRYEPAAGSESTLDQAQVIIGKKLPHGKYQYRVYLLPHKMGDDKIAKQQYVNWLKSQDPKITCTKAIEKWFIDTSWNWDRRYILVEDDHTLLLLKLRNTEVVGRIYNYIIG